MDSQRVLKHAPWLKEEVKAAFDEEEEETGPSDTITDEFYCTICQAEFDTAANLGKHVLSCGKCGLCGFATESLDEARLHANSCCKCLVCGIQHYSQAAFVKHTMKHMLKDVEVKKEVVLKEEVVPKKSIACREPNCTQAYSSWAELTEHDMKEHLF